MEPKCHLHTRMILLLVAVSAHTGTWPLPISTCAAQVQSSRNPSPRVVTDDSSLQTPDRLLDGLNNPRGVAVQPGTGHVFVAESGAGRVIRMVERRAESVVVGFSLEPLASAPALQIGPLSLVFLPNQMMVIGEGGQADGADQLHAIRIPNVGEQPVKVTTGVSFSPLNSSGNGDFFGMTRSATSIYVVGGGSGRSWIGDMRLPKGDGKFDDKEQYGPIGPLLVTSASASGSVPLKRSMAITLNAGGELVVGEAGDGGMEADSSICFVRVNDGRQLLSLQTGLLDIVSLAYSTKDGRDLALYALDHASAKPERGGLYRLDATLKSGKQAIDAVRIAKLKYPTGMAFGPDGELYVTELGADASVTSGRLLRFAPGL